MYEIQTLRSRRRSLEGAPDGEVFRKACYTDVMWKSLLTLALVGTLHLGAAPVSLASVADEKKPLTEKELASGAFRHLTQMTGATTIDLRMLYEVSGAKDFEEFSRTLYVARILRLDHGLLLRSLHSQSLERSLYEFGIDEKQVEEAIETAKKALKEADKAWEEMNRR